jgi:hypothetical protein
MKCCQKIKIINEWFIVLTDIILLRKSQLVTSYSLRLDVNIRFWNPVCQIVNSYYGSGFITFEIFPNHNYCLNCNIMINNNTISSIYILTNPVLINDTSGFDTCLQFDKAGYSPWFLISATLHNKTNRYFYDKLLLSRTLDLLCFLWHWHHGWRSIPVSIHVYNLTKPDLKTSVDIKF